MSTYHPNRNKVSLALESLDERLAPTTMGGLAALVQTNHSPFESLDHDFFRHPGGNTGGQASASMSQGAAGSPTTLGGGGSFDSLNHDFFRFPTRQATVQSKSIRKAAAHTKAVAPKPSIAPARVNPAVLVTPAPGTLDPATSAKVGPMLSQLYQEYQSFVSSGGGGTFTSGLSSMIRIEGNNVGVDLQAKGDFNLFVTNLQNLGMKVEVADAGHRMVEGLLPIDQIPNAVNLLQTDTITPIYRPMTR